MSHMKRVIKTMHYPPARDGKRCPDCGTTKDDGANGHGGRAWNFEDEPCADSKECIKALRGRIETIEATLERHNF